MIGTAISAMIRGLERMTPPWKPKSSTTVASRPMTEAGLIRAMKVSTAARPPLAISKRRARTPAISGMTTYRPTESSSVSQGTEISATPSRSATMGAKANTITASFTPTCASV